jgi:hypothetical protein
LIGPLDQRLDSLPASGQYDHVSTKPNMINTRRTSLRRPLPPWRKSRHRISSLQVLQMPPPHARPGQWLACLQLRRRDQR